MADMRNWIATLWPSSYKGQPFFFDADDEEGGRNPVIHKFPNRDLPYVEDLGEEPRFYAGTAYVHGNDADAQAKALIAKLAARGPGYLVLPDRGPVLVQALPFKRKWEKDKLGYVAFEVKFVREGAATALISIPVLANSAFGAIDTMAAAAAAAVANLIAVADVPDYVAASATDTLAAGAATFDAVRLSNAVEPLASATLRDSFADLVGDAGDEVADLAAFSARLTAAARDLGDAMAPEIAARAMIEVADAFAAPAPPAAYLPRWTLTAAINAAEATRAVRLAALAAFADAVIRRAYAARPDGVAARAAAMARFADELNAAPGAANAALYIAIAELRGKVADYLSLLIADLAPVVTVSSPRILPSLFWSWRLYADPARSAELVARNRVRHPSFMPETFTALAR